MELGIIGLLIVGALAGWLATTVMKKKAYSLWANLGIGVVGAFLGGFLFRLVGFAAYGWIANLVVAFIGALVLLWLIDYFKKR